MAASRDWMFCPHSGFLLTLDPDRGAAVCSVSGFKRDLSGRSMPPPAHAAPVPRGSLHGCMGVAAELEHVKVVLKSDMEVRAWEPLLLAVIASHHNARG
jgi:hypothetical protein